MLHNFFSKGLLLALPNCGVELSRGLDDLLHDAPGRYGLGPSNSHGDRSLRVGFAAAHARPACHRSQACQQGDSIGAA